jgi:hypothetical protein
MTDNSMTEESVLLLLLVLGYVLPGWTALYVFYWDSRHQFNAKMELSYTLLGTAGSLNSGSVAMPAPHAPMPVAPYAGEEEPDAEPLFEI